MARLRLDQTTLHFSTLLERLSGARVKDCFQSDQMIYFVVGLADMGRAIGKKAIHIKKLEKDLNKKVRVIAYSEDIKVFISNLISPVKVAKIEETDSLIILKDTQRKTKSLLIGRDGKQLQLINRAVQRFFQKQVTVE